MNMGKDKEKQKYDDDFTKFFLEVTDSKNRKNSAPQPQNPTQDNKEISDKLNEIADKLGEAVTAIRQLSELLSPSQSHHKSDDRVRRFSFCIHPSDDRRSVCQRRVGLDERQRTGWVTDVDRTASG